VARTRNYLRAWAESRASAINAKTLAALMAAQSGDVDPSNQGATPSGVFDLAAGYRASQQSQTISTQVASWGVMEAGRQCAPSGTLKTWVHHPSKSPRADHERMDGETVGIRERFSNGADWPGDTKSLSAGDVANCHCEVELTIPDGGDTRMPPTSADVPNWYTTKAKAKHLREHVAEFGLDIESAADRQRYDDIFSDVIDNYEHVVYSNKVSGQHQDECAIFLKGDVFAVVNLDGRYRVTMFRHKEGRSVFYERIWNQTRE